MATHSRRALLKHMLGTGAAALTAALTAACGARVPDEHAPPITGHPSASDAKPTGRETASATEIPQVIQSATHLTPTRPITPPIMLTPAPVAPVTLQADVLNYGWSRLAQEMTTAFHDAHPHITIQWRSLTDWRDYPDRLAILRASGQLGDLIESPCPTLTTAWAQDGMVADLDPLLDAGGFDTSALFPGALDAYIWRGHLMGLPLSVHGGEHVLLYDEELLDRASAPHPGAEGTLDGLSTIAEQVASAQAGFWGHIVPTRLPEAYPLLRAFGGDLLDAEGARCIVSEPEGIAFLSWLQRQVLTARTVPTARSIERGPTAMWQSGRAAMLHTNLRHAVALLGMQPKRQIEVLPLPAMPDSPMAPALMSGVGYCIPATSRQRAEALQWIKFILTHEAGVRLFVENYAEPGSRMSVWQDARVLDHFPGAATIAAVLARAEPPRVPVNLATEQLLQVWNAHVPRMLAGELSPEDTANQITEDLDAVLGARGVR